MKQDATPQATIDSTLIEALRHRLAVDTGQPVGLVETHISWVLLAGRLAYKLKKPVQLPFVDFSTLVLRKHFCEEELRLNRRLAPSLYVDVVPIRGSVDEPRPDGPGETVDYAVRMRRFPSDALLSEQLTVGKLSPEHVERLARRLAAFHQDAPVVAPVVDAEATELVVAPVINVLRQLRDRLGTERIAPLESWVQAQAHILRDAWPARQRNGQVRECHGDLHLANAVVLDDEVTAFDCIEFDPALRRTDVMADVGFLSMDLQAHGRSDLAFHFLDAYLQCSGDYAGLRVLRFYEVYRALVRALVDSLRVRSDGVHMTAGGPDYLACAERIAHGSDSGPRLLITHGVSGSGKSTVARQLLAAAGAIRLRSDVERKRLFAMRALERSPAHAPIYAPDATVRTYQWLGRGARTALQAGYPVIVDATFLQHSQRAAFCAIAAELNAPFTILNCTASDACLRERVAARSALGDDASEADLAVLERQLAEREPLRPDEAGFALELATDETVDVPVLRKRWLGADLVPQLNAAARRTPLCVGANQVQAGHDTVTSIIP